MIPLALFNGAWKTDRLGSLDVMDGCHERDSPNARFSFSSNWNLPLGPLKSSLSPIFSLSMV